MSAPPPAPLFDAWEMLVPPDTIRLKDLQRHPNLLGNTFPGDCPVPKDQYCPVPKDQYLSAFHHPCFVQMHIPVFVFLASASFCSFDLPLNLWNVWVINCVAGNCSDDSTVLRRTVLMIDIFSNYDVAHLCYAGCRDCAMQRGWTGEKQKMLQGEWQRSSTCASDSRTKIMLTISGFCGTACADDGMMCATVPTSSYGYYGDDATLAATVQ